MSYQRADRKLAIDLLSEARDSIVAGWTQHGPAADAEGRPMLDVRRAAAWSPIGALQLACIRRELAWSDVTTATAVRALQIACVGENRPSDLTVACCDIANANDLLERASGQAVVLRWFTTAIGVVTKSLQPSRRAAGGAR